MGDSWACSKVYPRFQGYLLSTMSPWVPVMTLCVAVTILEPWALVLAQAYEKMVRV